MHMRCIGHDGSSWRAHLSNLCQCRADPCDNLVIVFPDMALFGTRNNHMTSSRPQTKYASILMHTLDRMQASSQQQQQQSKCSVGWPRPVEPPSACLPTAHHTPHAEVSPSPSERPSCHRSSLQQQQQQPSRTSIMGPDARHQQKQQSAPAAGQEHCQPVKSNPGAAGNLSNAAPAAGHPADDQPVQVSLPPAVSSAGAIRLAETLPLMDEPDERQPQLLKHPERHSSDRCGGSWCAQDSMFAEVYRTEPKVLQAGNSQQYQPQAQKSMTKLDENHEGRPQLGQSTVPVQSAASGRLQRLKQARLASKAEEVGCLRANHCYGRGGNLRCSQSKAGQCRSSSMAESLMQASSFALDPSFLDGCICFMSGHERILACQSPW